ncbi:hypothetical protein DNI29_22425 [Hymenobacter sediminis]|uniref:hypothetical protein n=1 Tax=Hymenobacter sediminis TaxID=2218621 RepID=UPI000DA6BEDC|nr:hypothetical protein [Hymenobacter sediminis]RPD44155.1 hypothetical protein DNI29_22425 [Hymenobacter sediminis]
MSVSRRTYYVTWARALTQGTRLEPDAYEQHLLEQYRLGTYSLEQILAWLDERDQPVCDPSEHQLAYEAKKFNEEKQVGE